MANNVYSTIQIETSNSEAEAAFLRVFTELEVFNEVDIAYCTFFPTNEEIVDTHFMDEWIGPRTAELTKFMGTEVEIKSAWISPHKFLENLLEHLRTFDINVKLSMTYEDEFLNFAGVYVNEKMREESGGWFKKGFDDVDFEDDFLAYVIDELC